MVAAEQTIALALLVPLGGAALIALRRARAEPARDDHAASPRSRCFALRR